MTSNHYSRTWCRVHAPCHMQRVSGKLQGCLLFRASGRYVSVSWPRKLAQWPTADNLEPISGLRKVSNCIRWDLQASALVLLIRVNFRDPQFQPSGRTSDVPADWMAHLGLSQLASVKYKPRFRSRLVLLHEIDTVVSRVL